MLDNVFTILGNQIRAIALCSLIIAACCYSSVSLAEPLAIGVPEFDRDINSLSSTHPMAMIVKSAVSTALLRATANISPTDSSSVSYELSAADKLKVSPDYRRWEFRLRGDLQFSNGRRIQAGDVVFSLMRCSYAGTLSGIRSVKVKRDVEKIDMLDEQPKAEWIVVEHQNIDAPVADFKQIESTSKVSLVNDFVSSIISCPIVERASGEVFGDLLGRGSTFVAGGDFSIARLLPGREVELAWSQVKAPNMTGTDRVLIRGYPKSDQGLVALRSGAIAALFTSDREILEKAGLDETLQVAGCGNYEVVLRRGVVLPCAPSLRLAEFKY